MNCIIVDDEPLARRAIKYLVDQVPALQLLESFNNAASASGYLATNDVDLVFLDIQMPHITGLEFARTIPKETLIIFTTAYSEYALDSYEVDAVDYLIKPIPIERFRKAVNKAIVYHSLLTDDSKEDIEQIDNDFIFVKSERRFCKINFRDILFIEGLKDYVIIQMDDHRVITKMNLKAIHEQLPKSLFMRINKSYIVNTGQIESFDNNDVFIKTYQISIGNTYRDTFLQEFVVRKKHS